MTPTENWVSPTWAQHGEGPLTTGVTHSWVGGSGGERGPLEERTSVDIIPFSTCGLPSVRKMQVLTYNPPNRVTRNCDDDEKAWVGFSYGVVRRGKGKLFGGFGGCELGFLGEWEWGQVTVCLCSDILIVLLLVSCELISNNLTFKTRQSFVITVMNIEICVNVSTWVVEFKMEMEQQLQCVDDTLPELE